MAALVKVSDGDSKPNAPGDLLISQCLDYLKSEMRKTLLISASSSSAHRASYP